VSSCNEFKIAHAEANWTCGASAQLFELGEVVMQNMFARFVKCESGATAIEYGLIAALIGVAIIAAVNAVGTEVQGTFTGVETGLKKRPAVT
jgi:pilus assembly protein Flp/PilA